MAEKPKDLTPNEFPKIVWEPGKLTEPLEELFTCVVKEANDAIAWYNLRRKPKQYGGQILRVGALIFVAVAGLVPILGEIFQDNERRPEIAPAWATIRVVGTVNGVDRRDEKSLTVSTGAAESIELTLV